MAIPTYHYLGDEFKAARLYPFDRPTPRPSIQAQPKHQPVKVVLRLTMQERIELARWAKITSRPASKYQQARRAGVV